MKPWLTFSLVIAIAIAAALLGWVGYIESDDQFYAQAAVGWLTHFPFVSSTHWGLRHAIVLPMAAIFAVGGVNEAGLVAPITLYYLALIALTFLVLRRITDLTVAFWAAVLLALTPLFAIGASFVVDDLPELFFEMGSFWAFYAATQRDGSSRHLLLSGALAGLAWITRETTVALLVFYGILFLFGFGMARMRYFWMAGSFLAIVGADTIYLWAETGDFIYRYDISLIGVATDNPDHYPGAERHDLIAASKYVRPFIVLFVSHEFALLNLLAVPAAIWLVTSKTIDAASRDLARLLSLLAVVWFLVLSYAFLGRLWSLPRYNAVPAYCATVLIALWLTHIGFRRIPKTAICFLAALIASDLLFTYLDNKNLLFGERLLVALSEETKEPIYTDNATRSSASFLLRAAGTENEIKAGPPPVGSLFFYNAAPHRPGDEKADADMMQRSEVIEKFDEQPRISAQLARATGLLRFLPGALRNKLDPPPREAVLYRVR